MKNEKIKAAEYGNAPEKAAEMHHIETKTGR